MAPAMRVVNRRKVGRVKAPAKGRINRRRGSGRMAMGASLLVGDGWCYPHLTDKGALLVDATGPPRAFQKDRSRAQETAPNPDTRYKLRSYPRRTIGILNGGSD